MCDCDCVTRVILHRITKTPHFFVWHLVARIIAARLSCDVPYVAARRQLLFDNPTKTMPVRIQDVEGVTSQLAAYIGAGEGPLEQRKHDVEQLFRDRVTGDLSLLLCPAPGEVDPGLWGVMISSLLTPTEGETTARAQRASILVAEIREATRLRDQRIRSKRTRAAKKQAGYHVWRV